MGRGVLALSAGLVLLGAGARAQPAAPQASEELRRLCPTTSMAPADGRAMARRAECVLSGALPSTDRIAQARNLARSALAQGEPLGGLMLYMAWERDPANQAQRDGKPDPEAYRRLAARSMAQRKDQVEALEGLAMAADKGSFAASLLLATYYHDTVAPHNVLRLASLADLVTRNGQHHPALERMASEATAIQKNAAGTKASVRSFFGAYHDASVAAEAGYRSQSGGKSCSALQLQSVSASEVQAAEYLPLKGPLVAGSYLVHGHWSEFWTFQGCGEDVPVKVDFAADGWGGSSSRASYNKGS